MKPVLLVIAGPNGAGKTTVTRRLRVEKWSEGVEYLNPDDIAQNRFGDWNSPQAVLQAARWTETRREQLLATSAGIAFETAFSSAAKVDFVARAKARGYFVRVFFIGTADPRINAARVAGRVMAGGHSVPIEKIVSRFYRAMANLPSPSRARGPASRVAPRRAGRGTREHDGRRKAVCRTDCESPRSAPATELENRARRPRSCGRAGAARPIRIGQGS